MLLERSAASPQIFAPIIVLAIPVTIPIPVLRPIAVLFEPVVREYIAPLPIAVLRIPVVFQTNAA